MRVSVTGSHGFLGSILCKLLQGEKQFDLLNHNDFTYDEIRDKIVNDCDVVIHLAAISGIKACNESMNFAVYTNTTNTLRLANRAKEAGVKRFIFASSSAVYGESRQPIMDESHPTNPRSTYGVTKLMAEKILDLADCDFEVVVLRQSNLYGYGMVFKGINAIDQFIQRYLDNQPMEITGTGSQKRDFLHVMDCAGVYRKLATASKVNSGIYNLGAGEVISMRELAELVNDLGDAILGYRVPVTYTNADTGAMWHDFTYSYEKARREFQFTPLFRISEYIKERLLIHLRASPDA